MITVLAGAKSVSMRYDPALISIVCSSMRWFPGLYLCWHFFVRRWLQTLILWLSDLFRSDWNLESPLIWYPFLEDCRERQGTVWTFVALSSELQWLELVRGLCSVGRGLFLISPIVRSINFFWVLPTVSIQSKGSNSLRSAGSSPGFC